MSISLRKAAITARCAVPGELSGRRSVATLVRSFPVAVAFPFIAASALAESLEVFNNDTGATTVFMGGAGP
ncbi:MAG TPA: hypothetical protein VJ420_08045 [Candidatus Udaeobacter sp.]|nr:hypothetical protein [Candidatus Udaeobacter sp.]